MSKTRQDLTENSSWDQDQGLILLKTTHPDQDETEMRRSEIEANKTWPRQDCPKFVIQVETETRHVPKFCEFGKNVLPLVDLVLVPYGDGDVLAMAMVGMVEIHDWDVNSVLCYAT